ncbi:MAG: protein translocase subunit SecF [Desulfomicrobiaceae bacterium]|nr:protein translocase subunit SecF [Desulfomicrobiaceae bacterium]
MPLTLFSQTPRFDFIGNRRKAYVLSALLLLLGVLSLVVKGGPRYGIDFVGGMVVQAKSAAKVDVRTVEQALAPAGLAGMVVQEFGAASDNEVLIRVAAKEEEAAAARTAITKALAQIPDAHFEIQRVDMVGAKVSSDLRAQALEALFYAVLLISIYISGRFEQKWMIAAFMAACLGAAVYGLGLLDVSKEVLILGALAVTLVVCWKLKLFYALGATVALIHDTLITVGAFSLLNKEIDLSIVAALLTIIGYSLNDTIIVFDRIRENLRAKISPHLPVTINVAINQTLSRTVLTSGTTLLVTASLFVLGGGVIHDFAFALLVGIGVGTYSSIFVAAPILLEFGPNLPEEEGPAAAQAKTA